MPTPTTPRNEADRLEELKKYEILDSLSEEEYEQITFLASLICQVPIALISFVDQDRQWFKSHRGLNAEETPRTQSFCAHAIISPQEVFVVPDSRLDNRFRENPLVTGEPNIVFYGGAPLITANGYGLGTVCVIDRKPRELTEDQQKGLQILAGNVMKLLESRYEATLLRIKREQAERKIDALDAFAMVVAHDIKSPLSSIQISNELLELEYQENPNASADRLIQTSKRSVQKISSLVSGILEHTRAEKPVLSSFNVTAMLESIRDVLPPTRPFELHYLHVPVMVHADAIALEQILINLLSNSIKYNDKPVAMIWMSMQEEADRYHFTITDNGIGVTEQDQVRIFELFETVAPHSYGQSSNGIGLATVKRLVELNGGTIEIESVPAGGLRVNFTLAKLPNRDVQG